MSKTALEDLQFTQIKSYILDPATTQLSDEHKFMYDRIMSVARVLDKNPLQKQALSIHMAKYPELQRSIAYRDINFAVRLFNTIHTFDYDFWHTWLINDIVKNIERSRNESSPAGFKIVAMEHANLIKAIGERPEQVDPRRLENQNTYFLIQYNNTQVKIDVDNLHNLPDSTLRELNKAIFSGKEITESDAEEIFNT